MGSHAKKLKFKGGINPGEVMTVAKDGTRRGGKRIGAGRKPKALNDKVNAGAEANVISFPGADEMVGVEMPPVKEYLKAEQRNGGSLQAEAVFKETWDWLVKRNCASIINPQLVSQYAMSAARWIQCEDAISKMGLLAKHPTTGAPIASPFVSMSQNYMRQVNQLWYQIFQVVKENSLSAFEGANPHDDMMERLLRSKK